MKNAFLTTDQLIENIYRNIGITKPNQIDMHVIAKYFGAHLDFVNFGSQVFAYEEEFNIFIHKYQSKQELWQDFGHEFSHVVKHAGNQQDLPEEFVYLQENQAKSFMYRFCVPTFMLLDMNISNYQNIQDGVDIVSETFNVTKEFAKERLEMFREQMFAEQLDKKFIEDFNNRPVMNYSKHVKPRRFPSHTNDIVALAMARKKAKEGVSS